MLPEKTQRLFPCLQEYLYMVFMSRAYQTCQFLFTVRTLLHTLLLCFVSLTIAERPLRIFLRGAHRLLGRDGTIIGSKIATLFSISRHEW